LPLVLSVFTMTSSILPTQNNGLTNYVWGEVKDKHGPRER